MDRGNLMGQVGPRDERGYSAARTRHRTLSGFNKKLEVMLWVGGDLLVVTDHFQGYIRLG
jgi:hypothetical protein